MAQVAVSHCDAAAKDVKDQAPKLLRAIHAMKSPTDFAYHVGKDLVVNHADIFQEVSAAIDAFEHQLWEDIGKNVGAALAKLVVGETFVMQLLVGETRQGNFWEFLPPFHHAPHTDTNFGCPFSVASTQTGISKCLFVKRM